MYHIDLLYPPPHFFKFILNSGTTYFESSEILKKNLKILTCLLTMVHSSLSSYFLGWQIIHCVLHFCTAHHDFLQLIKMDRGCITSPTRPFPHRSRRPTSLVVAPVVCPKGCLRFHDQHSHDHTHCVPDNPCLCEITLFDAVRWSTVSVPFSVMYSVRLPSIVFLAHHCAS